MRNEVLSSLHSRSAITSFHFVTFDFQCVGVLGVKRFIFDRLQEAAATVFVLTQIDNVSLLILTIRLCLHGDASYKNANFCCIFTFVFVVFIR